MISLAGGDIRYGWVAGSEMEAGFTGVEGRRGGAESGGWWAEPGDPLEGVCGADPGGVTPVSRDTIVRIRTWSCHSLLGKSK